VPRRRSQRIDRGELGLEKRVDVARHQPALGPDPDGHQGPALRVVTVPVTLPVFAWAGAGTSRRPGPEAKRFVGVSSAFLLRIHRLELPSNRAGFGRISELME
jgi:hypothetical protein